MDGNCFVTKTVDCSHPPIFSSSSICKGIQRSKTFGLEVAQRFANFFIPPRPTDHNQLFLERAYFFALNRLVKISRALTSRGIVGGRIIGPAVQICVFQNTIESGGYADRHGETLHKLLPGSPPRDSIQDSFISKSKHAYSLVLPKCSTLPV